MTNDLMVLRWLDIVADLLQRPPGSLPRDLIGLELISSFDATGASFNHQDGHHIYIEMWPASIAPSVNTAEWELEDVLADHPLVMWYAATGSQDAQATDLLPDRIADTRYIDQWCERAGPYGLRHQLSIPIELRPGRQRAFVVAREDPPFTESEVLMARRLQRILIGLDQHARLLSRLPEPAAVEAVNLTPRQAVVLALLASGLTADGIGRRLGCSPRTIQKHLERTYVKLGVRDRLSAVLRAQAAGVLPGVSTDLGQVG